MKIKPDCISFRSLPEFYAKERDGTKPHTERILSRAERNMLWEKLEDLDTRIIEIENQQTRESFRRIITDVSEIGRLLGTYLTTISWEKEI